MASRVVTKWTCPGCGAPRDEPFANCPDCGGHKDGLPAYHCESHGDLAGPVCPTCMLAEQRSAKLKDADECLAHGHWRKATALCDELITECPGFPGVDECHRRAVDEGERRERERRERERRDTEIQEREARERRDREGRERLEREAAEAERARREAEARLGAEAGQKLKMTLCLLLLGVSAGAFVCEYGQARSFGFMLSGGISAAFVLYCLFASITASTHLGNRAGGGLLAVALVSGAGWLAGDVITTWKLKADWGASLRSENYLDTSIVSCRLAPKWQPAVKFLEYWQARREFETAMKEFDPATCKHLGGKAWAEVEKLKATGEAEVNYPFDAGMDAYRGAIEKLGAVRAIMDVKSDYAKAIEAAGDTSTAGILARFEAARYVGWQRASEQGVAEGQWLWGLCLHSGNGVAQDKGGASALFRKAAEQGLPAAAFYVGLIVERDLQQAAVWYGKAAAAGYPPAQLSMGMCCANGEGVAKDDAAALAWFEKAATQGDRTAQCNAGTFFYCGRATPQDYSKAFTWFSKSAEQGYPPAQQKLAHMYLRGEAVPKNIVIAFKWYALAAAAGDAWSQATLGNMYAFGQGTEKNDALAVTWWEKAAAQGDTMAQSNLGVAYRDGLGVSKDQAKAIQWFQQAAEKGDAAAQNNLGISYATGDGVQRNDRMAADWFTRSARQDDVDGMNNLGILLRDNFDDKQNARKWFQAAAEKGHDGARANLAGLGTEGSMGGQKQVVAPRAPMPARRKPVR